MYKMIELPYLYNSLEPEIWSEIVNIHYNNHHKKYYNNLIEILNKENYDYRYSLEELPKHIDEFPLTSRGAILYNAGGVLNHDLYWKSLGFIQSLPTGSLIRKINSQWGNFNNFVREFNEKARYLIGSGYVFLVANSTGNLLIVNMVNQETPVTYNLFPLFNIDLWEHAYYLQYKNNRDSYINNFWNKANFDYASKKYEEIFG